jgi:hypothetical protein
MIANFFNKTKPVVIFVIVLLFFCFFTAATLLFKFNEISILFSLERLGVFCCFALLLLIVNFIIQKNELTQNNSYALLIIVLLFGTFYQTMFSNNLLFTNLFLLLGFRKIYSLRSGIKIKLKLFDAAFWIGCAAILYAWSIVYFALIYLAIIINQKVDIKNLIIPIVGLLTPIIIYFSYCFYLDNTAVFLISGHLTTNFNYAPYNDFKLLLPITFLLSIGIWSIVLLTPKFMTKGLNLKRTWRVVLNHLIISIIIIVFSPIKNGSEMFFLIVPISIIVANFLKKAGSNNFKNLVLYLFVLIAVGVYFL